MKPEDFTEEAVHELYSKALARVGSHAGPKYTSNSLKRDAVALGYESAVNTPVDARLESDHSTGRPFDLDRYVPNFFPMGMPAREFVGPNVGHAKLFPLDAICLFVALGGTGKTTSVIAIAAHIAAGKAWGSNKLTRRKGLMFFVEEDQSELDRKFGAVTFGWSLFERDMAIMNLRLISLKDRDPRLTQAVGRSIASTGLADQVSQAALEFEAKFIVCDHLQGLTGGDMNTSDTATGLAQEANSIVSQTGAAVIFTAHTNKSQISAQDVGHGFTTGSLAFENAARQVTGAIPLPDDDAKRLGLEDNRKDYIKLEMPKNSYGMAGESGYLKKEIIPHFHTVAVKPYEPPVGTLIIPLGKDNLQQKVYEHIHTNPCLSKNKLENMSGKKGQFKASKENIRAALKSLIEDGTVKLMKPTKAQLDKYDISHQTKKVLICSD
jgi:RecA-family ATPase